MKQQKRVWYYAMLSRKFEYFSQVDNDCKGNLSYLQGPFKTLREAKSDATSQCDKRSMDKIKAFRAREDGND